jgi:hypothetical protein
VGVWIGWPDGARVREDRRIVVRPEPGETVEQVQLKRSKFIGSARTQLGAELRAAYEGGASVR